MANKTKTRDNQVGCLVFDWLPVQEWTVEDAKQLGEFTMTGVKSSEITLLDEASSGTIVPHGFVTKMIDNTDDGLDAEVHFGLLELLGSATLVSNGPTSPAEANFNDEVTHKGGAASNNRDVGIVFSTDSNLSNGVWCELTPSARALATLL